MKNLSGNIRSGFVAADRTRGPHGAADPRRREPAACRTDGPDGRASLSYYGHGLLRWLGLVLLGATLCRCGGTGGYTLSGRYAAPGDTLRLVSLFEEDAVVAMTVVRSDSTFRFAGKLGQPLVVSLCHGERRIGLPLLLEAGDIRFEPSSQMPGCRFVGTPLNDAQQAMVEAQVRLVPALEALEAAAPSSERDRALDSLGAVYRRIPSDALAANRDNLFGLFLCARRLGEDPEEIRRRLEAVPEPLLRNPVVTYIRSQAELLERTAVGAPYTELVLADSAGTPRRLSEFVNEGRCVLVAFWATWCHSCVEELPQLKAVWEAFREKGFVVYAVSIDSEEARWRQFVDSHDFGWIQVRNRCADGESDARACYAVRYIPKNYLIAPDGRIVARDLHGEALAAKLRDLLE